MSLKCIISCYEEKTIPLKEDNVDELIDSFVKNGFTAKKLSDTRYVFKRGAQFAFNFNYSSDSMAMNVFLDFLPDRKLKIKVGNSGFPFEPLLMRKRFQKNLERYAKEIQYNGKLSVSEVEIKSIKFKSRLQFILAVTVLISVAAFIMLRKFLF